METLREESGSEKVYDIQYNVHFDNSEDYSQSEISAAQHESLSHDNNSQSNVKILSPAKHVNEKYQEGYKSDLRSKMHKAVSFINDPLPKFELENSENEDYWLDKSLIKDDQGNGIINFRKHVEINLIHESESLNDLSKSQEDSQEVIDLTLEMDDYGTNLLLDSPPKTNSLRYIYHSNNRTNSKRRNKAIKNLENLENNDNWSEYGSEDLNNDHAWRVDSWDKIFKDEISLRKHTQTHGERQFICPEKGWKKRFLDNSKLKRHRLVHSGEKPYKWHVWNKKFSLDFNLRTHIRTHTGEKPYVCNFPGWGKRFTQSSNLTAHAKTHSGKEQSNSCVNSNHSYQESRNNPASSVYSRVNDYDSEVSEAKISMK